jgi:hypothetical protein
MSVPSRATPVVITRTAWAEVDGRAGLALGSLRQPLDLVVRLFPSFRSSMHWAAVP